MTTEAHTEGPWHFDGPPDNHIVWSGPVNRICFMAHSNGVNPERDTANARLISAAPDLLEVLKGVMDILGRAESNASGNTEWDFVGPRVAKARAAINRAEGRS